MAYQLQMALYAELLASLYPGKSILSLLLWTADASIMEVDAEQRRSALDHVGVKTLTQGQ